MNLAEQAKHRGIQNCWCAHWQFLLTLIDQTFIILHFILYYQILCCLHLGVCSCLRLWSSWRSSSRGRWWFDLFSLWFLGHIRKFSWRKISEHVGWWLPRYGLFKILRGPRGIRHGIRGPHSITGIPTMGARWEIGSVFKFVHPTGRAFRRAVPTNVCYMFHICWAPNFHFTLLHNKHLREVFQDLCHDGNYTPQLKQQPP